MAETKEKGLADVKALKQFATDVMEVWKSTTQIRKLFAPNLTDLEFKFFMGQGIVLGANPFKREIFAVKYGTEPAQTIIARDFYRRRAQEQKDYGGHYVEAVYPGEKFTPYPDEGRVEHQFDFEIRYGAGEIVKPAGAYFVGKRGDLKFYHFVAFREVAKWIKDKKTGKLRLTHFWENSPEQQIKKVAESQGLRMMYQGIFAGTYSDDEAHLLETAEEVENQTEAGDVLSDLETKIQNRDYPKKERAEDVEAEEVDNEPEAPGDYTEDYEPDDKPDQQEEKDKYNGKNGDQADAFNKGEEADTGFPKWNGKGLTREQVLRKFKYIRTEKFPKVKEQLKEFEIYNLMQLARYHRCDDFTPEHVGPTTLKMIEDFLNGL